MWQKLYQSLPRNQVFLGQVSATRHMFPHPTLLTWVSGVPKGRGEEGMEKEMRRQSVCVACRRDKHDSSSKSNPPFQLRKLSSFSHRHFSFYSFFSFKTVPKLKHYLFVLRRLSAFWSRLPNKTFLIDIWSRDFDWQLVHVVLLYVGRRYWV